MGLTAAYGLSKAGHQVEVFEARTVGNELGGSSGAGRIFRLTYEEPEVVRQLLACREAWLKLQEELGEKLLREVGGIDYGDNDRVGSMAAALESAGVEYELWGHEECAKRLPDLRVAGDVLFQGAAAVIESERFLRTLSSALKSRGAPVHELTHVDRVLSNKGGAVLYVGQGEMRFDSVVIAAGAGTRELCGDEMDLPEVRITEEFMLECDLDAPIPVGNDYQALPVKGDGYYWLNSSPGRLKVGAFASGAELPPSGSRRDSPPRGLVDLLIAYTSETFLRGAIPSNTATKAGIFDLTDDGWFYFRSTSGATIVAIGGFSGHGFKFAPLVGRSVVSAIETDGAELPSGLPWGPLPPAAV